MNTSTVEVSSGKDTAYENFPVGSWLLPAKLRPHIATFYHFARAADDIADSPDLASEEKILRLDQFEEGLSNKSSGETPPPQAGLMAASLIATNVTPSHCLDLLAAFKQDATKTRYANWQELIDYCQLSAAPVGRYLIDLHGGFKVGDQAGYEPSDALCAALQILNHLQDCREDYQELDRVYLPADILAHNKAKIEDLTATKATPSLRNCLNEILAGVDELMRKAAALPTGLKSTRLAMESQAIINIANRLSRKLRQNDPIQGKVKLSKIEYITCCISGALGSLFR